MTKPAQKPDECRAEEWCKRYGFEFCSWDGTFCHYRDPRKAGTLHEYGVESWITHADDEGAA